MKLYLANRLLSVAASAFVGILSLTTGPASANVYYLPRPLTTPYQLVSKGLLNGIVVERCIEIQGPSKQPVLAPCDKGKNDQKFYLLRYLGLRPFVPQTHPSDPYENVVILSASARDRYDNPLLERFIMSDQPRIDDSELADLSMAQWRLLRGSEPSLTPLHVRMAKADADECMVNNPDSVGPEKGTCNGETPPIWTLRPTAYPSPFPPPGSPGPVE